MIIRPAYFGFLIFLLALFLVSSLKACFPMSAKPKNQVLLLIAFIGFISLGLPDAVPGVAWPSLRENFHLEQSGLGAILACIGIGYLLSSFLTGRLTQLLGISKLLILSSALVTISLFGYASSPVWYIFLACAFVTGIGSGAIDAGLNTFAADNFSVRQVNWLHACYSIGAMLGPFLVTSILVGGLSWRLGYVTIAILLLLMTVLFFFTRKQWNVPATGSGSNTQPETSTIAEALQQPLVWLQMAVFFMYTSLEVTTGQWCFTLLTESRGVDLDTAGIWTGCYYGSIAAGRIILGGIINRIGVERLMALSMGGAVIGSILFAVQSYNLLNSSGLILIGLSLSPIFPTLISRTPQLVGTRYSVHAIGFQVSAAMLGIAAGPSLVGIAGEKFGLESAGPILIGMALLLAIAYVLVISVSRRKKVLSA